MATALPTVQIDGKTYYVDRRLRELRNVEDVDDIREIPFDLKEFDIVAFSDKVVKRDRR